MLERVKTLLSKDFAEIKSSALSLELLKVYSALYMCGGQPRSCEKSMHSYFKQLQKDGIKKAKDMKEITNVCNKKGIVYVSNPMHKHVNFEQLSDTDAISLLKIGVLKKEDFAKLPDGYEHPKQAKQTAKSEEPKEEAKTAARPKQKPKVKVTPKK